MSTQHRGRQAHTGPLAGPSASFAYDDGTVASLAQFSCEIIRCDPRNMKEALARPDEQKKMQAMIEEIDRLQARNS